MDLHRSRLGMYGLAALRALLGRELAAKRSQARVLGETWAERVCRGDYRERDVWPEHEPKTLAIAHLPRRKAPRSDGTEGLQGLADACGRSHRALRRRNQRVDAEEPGRSADHRAVAVSREESARRRVRAPWIDQAHGGRGLGDAARRQASRGSGG